MTCGQVTTWRQFHAMFCGVSAAASPQAIEGFSQEDVTIHLVCTNICLVGIQPPAANQVSESLEGSGEVGGQEW